MATISRNDNSPNQLYNAYRPLRFGDLYGPTRSAAKLVVNALCKHDRVLPQKSWLISGDPSTGKTTLAMIMAMAMNCTDPREHEGTGAPIEPCLKCPSCLGITRRGLLSTHTAFMYYNVAAMRKEDIVGVIKSDMTSGSTLEGRYKFIVFEEAHNLTKQQKEALLKPVENTLKRVYLIFLTTEPASILSNRAMRGRLTRLTIGPWRDEDLKHLLIDVAKSEQDSGRAPGISGTGIDRIIESAEGDARVAISNLQLVLDGIRPGDGKTIKAEEILEALERPVEYSDDFRLYVKSILRRDFKGAFYMLEHKFDSRQGSATASSVAFSASKYLRRVAYYKISQGDHKGAVAVFKMLQVFASTFSTQTADDFTALSVATFAAINT